VLFTLQDHSVTPEATIQWNSPELNLWVANLGGEYAGMVEFEGGHFLSRDRFGNMIATFTDIPTAQLSVVQTSAVPLSALKLFRARFVASGRATATAHTKLGKNYRRSA